MAPPTKSDRLDALESKLDRVIEALNSGARPNPPRAGAAGELQLMLREMAADRREMMKQLADRPDPFDQLERFMALQDRMNPANGEMMQLLGPLLETFGPALAEKFLAPKPDSSPRGGSGGAERQALAAVGDGEG